MKDNLVYLRQMVDYIEDIEEYVKSADFGRSCLHPQSINPSI
jgi:uncharacterized protein with HEPN domain